MTSVATYPDKADATFPLGTMRWLSIPPTEDSDSLGDIGGIVVSKVGKEVAEWPTRI